MKLDLVLGDITTERVDAIVNAANRHLAGGGESTAPFTLQQGRVSCKPER